MFFTRATARWTNTDGSARDASTTSKRCSSGVSSRFRIARRSLLQIIWSVGPGWLARNDYFLIGPKGESTEQWLRRAAPKQRGKYRIDVGAFKKIPQMIPYHPSVRRISELGEQGQIFAICHKGQEKGRVLVMTPLSWPDGPLTWVAYDYRDMRKKKSDGETAEEVSKNSAVQTRSRYDWALSHHE